MSNVYRSYKPVRKKKTSRRFGKHIKREFREEETVGASTFMKKKMNGV